MGNCESFAPLVSRVAEGEASPDEAMRAAQHLSDCTACRILVARERRLAAILEHGLEDSLPVGEDFVKQVMENLPTEAPKLQPRKKKRHRNLKLACLAALVGLSGLLAGSGSGSGGPLSESATWSLAPEIQEPTAYAAAEGALQVGSLLWMVATDLAAGPRVFAQTLPVAAIPVLMLVPLALCALGLCAGLLAVATRGLLRTGF